MTGYLGTTSSLTGRRWIGPDAATERLTDAIEQSTSEPRSVAAVLAGFGVNADDAATYLAPTLRDLLPDPTRLKDMGDAASRIIEALDRRERVAIFADYDVDGASSAALLICWLRDMGLTATLYVPDRIDEGYGPNVDAMQSLAAKHDLIICVDCGTLSHEPVAAAKGSDVVILDHHLGGSELPKAHAVVNPNRQDEDGSLRHLCAAAVVFLLLVELNRRLKPRGAALPDLMALLDLVALATVADVAPLVGVNRAFVRQGLAIMARRARPGLTALADVARLDSAPNAYHLGFVFGPRINAGGRVGRADLGARLLSTKDSHEAASIAEKLDELNTERRDIETQVRDAALAEIRARDADTCLAWAAGDNWHPGVVGIVAARLKEATHRPAIVIGFDGEDGKGSGRSIRGVDLGTAIQRLADEGLIEKGGGHPMAAGLSLTRAQLEPAMRRLDDLLSRQGVEFGSADDLRITGPLMPGAATTDLVRAIEAAGPFGMGAPTPRFVFPDQKILSARRVGETHLKFRFGDGVTSALDGIAFGAFDGPLGPALEARDGSRFHLAGKIDINRWQGRETVQLVLEDAALA